MAYHRGRLARLKPKGRRLLRGGARSAAAARQDRRVRLDLPQGQLAPDDDPNIQALVEAQTPVVTVVGKTSMLHVTEVLHTTPEENLRMIRESVRLSEAPRQRSDLRRRAFLRRLQARPGVRARHRCAAAVEGGADIVVLCDTNGGTMPWEIERIVAIVRADAPAASPSGIHTHNDGETGRRQLAGGGSGRRGPGAGHDQRLRRALRQCQSVQHHPRPGAEDGLSLPARRPSAPPDQFRAPSPRSPTSRPIIIWPTSARAPSRTRAGIHVAAIRRNVDSYQHIDPALVGNEMRVLVSDLSGQGNVLQQGRGIWAGCVTGRSRQSS